MESILQRIQKLEEQVGLKKHSIIKESGSIIQIDPSYKYYELVVQWGYSYEEKKGSYLIFGLPIKPPGEFRTVYSSQYERIPGEKYDTEKEALSRIKQIYASKIVIPKHKLKKLESELYVLKNSDKLNFKPFGLNKGEYLFADYSVNEINALIKRHPTYQKLRRLGVLLRPNETEFAGYIYNDLHYSEDFKDNKLHLEFETKNGSTVFTSEAAIDNFRNYSKNMIFYSAGVILPKTSILTRKDLDNTLKVMLDSYINRNEIESQDDEE